MAFQRFPKVNGPITTALRAAIVKRKALLLDGMPEGEVDQIVGQDLKAVLVNPRSEPWHFLCDKCKDTGWRSANPTYFEMKRLKRLYGPNPQHQDYFEKCDPCVFIEKQRRERRTKQNEYDPDDFSQSAITKRRK